MERQDTREERVSAFVWSYIEAAFIKIQGTIGHFETPPGLNSLSTRRTCMFGVLVGDDFSCYMERQYLFDGLMSGNDIVGK